MQQQRVGRGHEGAEPSQERRWTATCCCTRLPISAASSSLSRLRECLQYRRWCPLTLVPVRMSGGLFVSAVGADTSEWEGFLRIVYVCLWTRRWVCDTFVEIWIDKYVNTAREHVYRHTHSHAHSVCSCTFAHKAKHTSTRAHSLTKLHNDKHTCTQTQTRVCARMMTYLRITLCHSMAVHLLHTYTRQEKNVGGGGETWRRRGGWVGEREKKKREKRERKNEKSENEIKWNRIFFPNSKVMDRF